MTNWKSLYKNPPVESCEICLRSGKNFETFSFVRYSKVGWSLFKNRREVPHKEIDPQAMYINLSDITC